MREIDFYKTRLKALQQEKEPNKELYRDVNKYVRQQGELSGDDEGLEDMISDRGIYESTAPESADKFASVMLGLMWPSSKKSFKINLAKGISEIDENLRWIEESQEELASLMDNPEVALNTSLYGHFYDQGTFGTSGIFISEDEETTFRFKPWSVEKMCIDEGKHGFVNTVYYQDEWTAAKLVDTYGIDKVSGEVRDAFNEGKVANKFRIVQAVEPLRKPTEDGQSFEGVVFEDESGVILDRSFFFEFPVPIVRNMKLTGSKYGRSASIILMATIKEINRKVNNREQVEEQEIDPALGYDVNAFGGDVLDSTPGAVNAFDTTMAGGNATTWRIVPQINLQILDESINRLVDKITGGFGLDRLLDFNNQVQMTAFETSKRDEIKSQLNNARFSVQETELFTFLIERCFNIAFRAGKFGVIEGSKEHQVLERVNSQAAARGKSFDPIKFIPKEISERMEKGENFYDIEYINPASRMRNAEELNGINTMLQVVASLAQMSPDVIQAVDTDFILRRVRKLTGVKQLSILAEDILQQVREQQAQAQAQQQQLQQAQQENEIGLQEKELNQGA